MFGIRVKELGKTDVHLWTWLNWSNNRHVCEDKLNLSCWWCICTVSTRVMHALTALFCECVYSPGLHENEDIRVMMAGSSMLKVRSTSWQRNRSMRLLEDGLTVWCESKSSRKGKAQQTCKFVWNPALWSEYSVRRAQCVAGWGAGLSRHHDLMKRRSGVVMNRSWGGKGALIVSMSELIR